jgi:hypothetical protein
MEAEAALRELVRSCSGATPAYAALGYRPALAFRGPVTLPLQLRGPARTGDMRSWPGQ